MKEIVVVCSKDKEWMLPWWWMHYHYHNSLPVTFIDQGMSAAAKQWCAKRGVVLPPHSSYDQTLTISLNAQVGGPLGIVYWTEQNIRGAMAICEKLLMNLTFEER